MGVIVPAILSASKADFDEKLERLSGIDRIQCVQIDVTDGRFSSPASWPYAGGTKEFAELVTSGHMLPHAGQLQFEIDLMVNNPEAVTGPWLVVGASRITVHAESTTYLPRVITDLRVRYGHEKDFAPDLVSFGLALNISSSLALIEPFIQYIDYVQFMGIAKIGRQGEPFDRRVLDRIRTFRQKYPKMPIQVDGGVSIGTAPALLAAGVDRLVIGSDLWKAPDLRARFAEFEALTNEYGMYEQHA